MIRSPENYGAFWKQHAAQAASTPLQQAGKPVAIPKNESFIPKEKLPEIWQSADWRRVIDIFGLQIDEKRRCKADEIWIKSPFTAEKNASLHLNLSENIFKDFSSEKGAKAGILNFCQDLLQQQGQSMNCYEVATWMVQNRISNINNLNTDITLSQSDSSRSRGDMEPNGRKKLSQTQRQAKNNRAIKVDLRRWLQTDHPQLQRRNVTKDICHYLGCGFLPKRPDEARQSPLNGRLVFQVRGVWENGRGAKSVILSHVGRAVTKEQEEGDGKYWSYPFYKGLEIYNQDNLQLDDVAKKQVNQFGLLLVEGFFDVAALVSSGIFNVGALMGSQLTQQQIEKIKLINKQVKLSKITVFLDRDEAGISGSEKAVILLRNNGFSAVSFDWEQMFNSPDSAKPERLSNNINDPGDMPPNLLKWLRKQGKI